MSEKVSENPLAEMPFSFRETKNADVLIYWKNKRIKILKGKDSAKFIAQIKDKADLEQQLILAKITGNFKRGNEREPKQKGKR